jgi:hypothetical protein
MTVDSDSSAQNTKTDVAERAADQLGPERAVQPLR